MFMVWEGKTSRRPNNFSIQLVQRFILKRLPKCVVVQHMVDDLDAAYNRLDRLAALVQLTLNSPIENRVHVENTLQLICRALQTAAWGHQQIGSAGHQKHAAEIMALRQWILEQARAAGLRITDSRSRR